MTQKPTALSTSFHMTDPAVLARNMGRAVEQVAGLVNVLVDTSEDQKKELNNQLLPMEQINATLSAVMQDHLRNPQRLMEAQTKLWSQYTQVWNNAWSKVIGQTAEPVIEPAKSDRRFKDSDWVENEVFSAIKQAYLLTTRWAQDLVAQADGLDPHTRQKARFYVDNIANALSPTNYILTNPEVLRTTLATNGENLVRGIERLKNDYNTPDGRLRISQVDKSAFKVGENLATTPGKVVFRNELFELIQYSPQVARTFEIPLLIVPPWINKFYILDLTAQKSLVRHCVENGITVFIISWANADAKIGRKSFSDFAKEGVLEAIAAVQRATNCEKVNTVGFCIGGSLLASTAAYLAAKDDQCINTLTLLTTQVDFEKAGDLLVYVDDEQVKWIEERMNEKGYLPGSRMADAFNLLRSNELIWSYVVNNYLLGKDPAPFDLLYWNSDSTSMPFGVHSFYLRECYLHNNLSHGKMMLDDVQLDLKKITAPIYNLACRDDHIAPVASVFRVAENVGSDVTFVVSGSGHIAGVVNPPTAKKYQYWTNTQRAESYEDWMKNASEHAGSWWPHWTEWLTARSGDKISAPMPGEGGLSTICDAPGQYVLVSGVN